MSDTYLALYLTILGLVAHILDIYAKYLGNKPQKVSFEEINNVTKQLMGTDDLEEEEYLIEKLADLHKKY